jgi:hypothetical protein
MDSGHGRDRGDATFQNSEACEPLRATERERLSIHGGEWYLSKKYGLSTIDI